MRNTGLCVACVGMAVVLLTIPLALRWADSSSHVLAPHDRTISNAQSGLAAVSPARYSYANVAVSNVLPTLPAITPTWLEYNPPEIVVSPNQSTRLTFHRLRFTREGRFSTWIGRADEHDTTIVGIATEAGWDAVIGIPLTGECDIHVRGIHATVVWKDPRQQVCSRQLGAGPTEARPDSVAMGDEAARIAHPLSYSTPSRAAVADAMTSDVLFFYDPSALSIASNWTSPGSLPTDANMVEATIRAQVETANIVLEQSGVANFRWNVVGVIQLPAGLLDRNAYQSDVLNQVSTRNNALGLFVQQKRDEYAADQVVVCATSQGVNGGGVAWCPGYESVIGWGSDYLTIGHELAHNIGCFHTRDMVDEVTGTRALGQHDGDGLIQYGYHMMVPIDNPHYTPTNGQIKEFDYGCIMSYTGPRAPFFSNPDLLVDVKRQIASSPLSGVKVMLSDPVPWGVADTLPRSADCARFIRENGHTIAEYRTQRVVPPTITVQPASSTSYIGQNVALSVSVSGSGPFKYSWFKNGAAVAGATTSTLTLTNVSSADSASYSVVVSNSAGTATGVVPLNIEQGCWLSNLSIRTPVDSGHVVIVGGVVNGGAKAILARVAGPALVPYSLIGNSDPKLALYTNRGLTAENDNWSPALASRFTSVGAFPFEIGSTDAALVQDIAGSFSVYASGGDSGIVLVELYDAGQGVAPRLVNISAMNRVGTGNDVLIAGFNVAGVGTKKLLIRAIGPTLAKFGVSDVLMDPWLDIYSTAGKVVASNDDWNAFSQPSFSVAGAFQLDPGSKDAALIMTFAAGSAYSVQVKGVKGATGQAMVEIYELP